MRKGDLDDVEKLATSGRVRSSIVLRARHAPIARRWVVVVFATTAVLSGWTCRRLARSKEWRIRAGVATQPAVPERTLRRLAHDEAWSVKAAVARRIGLTPDLAMSLTRAEPAVSLALATNPSISAEVAERLVGHRDEYVRGKVMAHPALPAAVLEERAKDIEQPAWVLRNIATNPNCPSELSDEILTWLAIGGGGTDPLFDPVTCTGHPGPLDQTAHQLYREFARNGLGAPGAALWLARRERVLMFSQSPGELSRYHHDEHRGVQLALLRCSLPRAVWMSLAHSPDPIINGDAAATTRMMRPVTIRAHIAALGSTFWRIALPIGFLVLSAILRAVGA